MFETEDVIDKVDARASEILDELAKTEMTSKDYTDMTKNLETLCKIKAEADSRDQNRLNNNARNDIEQMRIEVEADKLKASKLTNAISVIQTVVSLGGACLFAYVAYMGDLDGIANRPIMNVAQNLFSKALFIGKR